MLKKDVYNSYALQTCDTIENILQSSNKQIYYVNSAFNEIPPSYFPRTVFLLVIRFSGNIISHDLTKDDSVSLISSFHQYGKIKDLDNFSDINRKSMRFFLFYSNN